MGSLDSLLEITYRANVPPVLCDPTTPRPDDLTLPPLGDGTQLLQPLASPLGRDECLVKLECFRFLSGPPQQEQGPGLVLMADGGLLHRPQQTPSTPASISPETQDELLGSLEFLRFRESCIGSEYESTNTDDSDDRDSWGGQDESTLRLLNVLNKHALSDCLLDDEIAV